MKRTHTFARTAAQSLGQTRIDPVEALRSLIVLGCALALIMAGPVLPL